MLSYLEQGLLVVWWESVALETEQKTLTRDMYGIKQPNAFLWLTLRKNQSNLWYSSMEYVIVVL